MYWNLVSVMFVGPREEGVDKSGVNEEALNKLEEEEELASKFHDKLGRMTHRYAHEVICQGVFFTINLHHKHLFQSHNKISYSNHVFLYLSYCLFEQGNYNKYSNGKDLKPFYN